MPPAPRVATAVLLTTGTGAELRILLVQRSPALRFFGGFWAFPGGAMEDADRACGEHAVLSCALRELLEETALGHTLLGVSRGEARAWLAAFTSEAPPPGWREALRRVADNGRYHHVCRITTPEHIAIRFATDFVQLHCERAEDFELDAAELVAGEYVSPADAVARWRRGEMPIAPPTLLLLEQLATHGVPDFRAVATRIADSFEHGEFHPARFSPGVFTAPVPTPTLPPATTTNCYILGERELYAIDPAAVDAVHRDRLIRKLEALQAEGVTLRGVLLTHHHPDHVGSAALLSRHFGVPLHAHALCHAQLADADYLRGRALEDGDTLPLGTAPDGSPDWQLEVLHTPGHARDHLCYVESRYRAAIVGDMLSTVSTIVIDPPEGHMATYLASLERLLTVPMTTLYPAHGPSHRDGHALIRQYLEHRRARERKIVEALSDTPRTLAALLPAAYGDVAPAVHGAALRSLLAGLQKLEEEGRAAQRDGEWVRIAQT
ncbi:MAG: MBL fold metallo-hydrolase [Gammaproteobacteria bacterium]